MTEEINKKRERDRISKADKRSANGKDFVTYNYSENWRSKMKKSFSKLGHVFVRGAMDFTVCALIDQLIQSKISAGHDAIIMGNTKIIEVTEGDFFDAVYPKIGLILDELLGILYQGDSALEDITWVKSLVLMQKEPNCPLSQLPHADSMCHDLRMLLFTRLNDFYAIVTTSYI